MCEPLKNLKSSFAREEHYPKPDLEASAIASADIGSFDEYGEP